MIEYTISIKYMLAGYAVILTVLALYLVSLFIRWRNLKRDLQLFKETRKID
jgi:hypothetical protein